MSFDHVLYAQHLTGNGLLIPGEQVSVALTSSGLIQGELVSCEPHLMRVRGFSANGRPTGREHLVNPSHITCITVTAVEA